MLTTRVRSTRRSIAAVPQTSSLNNLTPITRRRSVAPSANITLSSKKTLFPTNTPLVLSQELKTPKANNTNNDTPLDTPKTTHIDPVMARIKRDLNSPSAAARIRATKAMKSPSFRKANYELFDVPHERQDILTSDERKSYKPKTIQEIFAKCKVYVEVRTGDDNRSAGIKNRLLREGITVNEKLYKDTTHVIFKDGLLSTYKNAIKLSIPITTILWFEACISQRRLVDPKAFKISSLDRYEHPELYKRMRRQKSMQPEISKLSLSQMVSTMEKSFSQDDIRQSSKNFDNETITEDDERERSEMELTLQNEKTICQTPVEIVKENRIDKCKENMRRITTFTPHPMEQTVAPVHSLTDRRRTLFTPHLTQHSEEQVLTPQGFSANSCKTVVFNSLSRISKSSRRSVFDISMNIFEINCKTLQNHQGESPPSARKAPELPKVASQSKIQSTQVLPTGTIRKRKLFNADNDDLDDCKENFNKSLKGPMQKKTMEKSFHSAVKPAAKKAKAQADRRKTIGPVQVERRETLFFKAEKPKDVSTKNKSSVKPVAEKVIVCTNMSSQDKLRINSIVTQLGGKIENEVSSRTTHVISPNSERTMNILRGVVRACWIVKESWIFDSLKQNKWLDTTVYQHDICDANRIYERSILGTKNYKNMTFANRGLFFLSTDGIDNVKKVGYLKEIITMCGGNITNTPSEAAYIVSDKPIANKDPNQFVVITTYIFDSAMKGSFVEVARYIHKEQKAGSKHHD